MIAIALAVAAAYLALSLASAAVMTLVGRSQGRLPDRTELLSGAFGWPWQFLRWLLR